VWVVDGRLKAVQIWSLAKWRMADATSGESVPFAVSRRTEETWYCQRKDGESHP
jgi:hypothetical protein